jgi:hypothetical protein
MIIKGIHQSGMGGANRSIRKQKKAFAGRGMLLENCFSGTININTAPLQYRVTNYDVFLKDVRYLSFPRFRKEDFGFIRIRLLKHRENVYQDWGYIYFAHKSPHFHNNSLFELLGPKLPGFKKTDHIEIEIEEGLMKCIRS